MSSFGGDVSSGETHFCCVISHGALYLSASLSALQPFLQAPGALVYCHYCPSHWHPPLEMALLDHFDHHRAQLDNGHLPPML
jgi:hypothetical protein